MKSFPQGQMYGTYGRDVVMVIGVPDNISDPTGDAMIYYHSPLTTKYGKSETVKWGDVKDIHGPAVEQRP